MLSKVIVSEFVEINESKMNELIIKYINDLKKEYLHLKYQGEEVEEINDTVLDINRGIKKQLTLKRSIIQTDLDFIDSFMVYILTRHNLYKIKKLMENIQKFNQTPLIEKEKNKLKLLLDEAQKNQYIVERLKYFVSTDNIIKNEKWNDNYTTKLGRDVVNRGKQILIKIVDIIEQK